MKKEVLFATLFLMVIVSACDQIDISKLSDEDLERISEKAIVCNAPYIRYAAECCLDQNDNKICDRDERDLTPDEKEKEERVNTPPVEETSSGISPLPTKIPAEPFKPETPKQVISPDRCILPVGITCVDFRADSSTQKLLVIIRNGLGFDLRDISVAAPTCISSPDTTLDNGAQKTFTLENCDFPSEGKYDGELVVTYTKVDSGLKRTIRGSITARAS